MDAFSVPRGRDCGCICQSCSAPLIARQGDVRVWHFAHATSDSNVEGVCDYSPVVSIRLMAHQILADLDKISLPPAPSESRTTPRKAQIESITIDSRFEESTVDAIATIKDTTLVIYMMYKARPIPSALYAPTHQGAGVLGINLDTIWKLLQESDFDQFEGSATKKHSYCDRLLRLLTQDTSARSWIYHPRQDKRSPQPHGERGSGIKLVSRDPLRQAPVRPQPQPEPLKPKKQQNRVRPIPDNTPLLARYVCQNCSETWIAGYDDEKAKSCPICKQRDVSMQGLPG